MYKVSFDHPKHMFKLIGNKNNYDLRQKVSLSGPMNMYKVN